MKQHSLSGGQPQLEAAPGAEKQRALFYDLCVTSTQRSNQPNQFLHSSFRLEQLNLFTCLFI